MTTTMNQPNNNKIINQVATAFISNILDVSITKRVKEQTKKIMTIFTFNGKNIDVEYSTYAYMLKRRIHKAIKTVDYDNIGMFRDGRENKILPNERIDINDKIFYLELTEMDYTTEIRGEVINNDKYLRMMFKKAPKRTTAVNNSIYFEQQYINQRTNKRDLTLRSQLNTAFGYVFLRQNIHTTSVLYHNHRHIKTKYIASYKCHQTHPKEIYNTEYSFYYRDYDNSRSHNEHRLTYPSITGLTPIISKNGAHKYDYPKKLLIKMAEDNGFYKKLSKMTTKQLVKKLMSV